MMANDENCNIFRCPYCFELSNVVFMVESDIVLLECPICHYYDSADKFFCETDEGWS
jgi:Zn ribbon nucleic-acid-binding protein